MAITFLLYSSVGFNVERIQESEKGQCNFFRDRRFLGINRLVITLT